MVQVDVEGKLAGEAQIIELAGHLIVGQVVVWNPTWTEADTPGYGQQVTERLLDEAIALADERKASLSVTVPAGAATDVTAFLEENGFAPMARVWRRNQSVSPYATGGRIFEPRRSEETPIAFPARSWAAHGQPDRAVWRGAGDQDADAVSGLVGLAAGFRRLPDGTVEADFSGTRVQFAGAALIRLAQFGEHDPGCDGTDRQNGGQRQPCHGCAPFPADVDDTGPARKVDLLVDAYTTAYEAAGGRMPQARRDGIAAVLLVLAAEIDRGPIAPLPPSVISELIRENAQDLTRTEG